MNTDDMTPHDDDTLEALGRALPRVAPPPDLGDRILAAAATDAGDAGEAGGAAGAARDEAPLAPVVPIQQARSWRRRTVVASLAAAACAAALAVGITLSVTGGDSSPGPLTASASVAAEPGARGAAVGGTASLYGADAPGGQIQVSLKGVPAPPPRHHYEVWVLEKGSTQMTSVGSFTPGSRDVDLTLPLPAPANYAAMDISVEPDGGSPDHSGTSLAGAKFA